ncbi:MAG: response regulator transcription factor [Planctomycetota bacterium]
MSRLLIVEDDENLRFGLRFNLEREGHEVREADSAEAAETILREGRAELILLDVMLPGRSGLSFLEALRDRGDRTPVVVLTARADESDAVTALSLGADDYVRKPFGLSELVARIGAILRRAAPRGGTAAGRLVVGPWTVDLGTLDARREGGEERLTHLEAQVLEALAQRRGEVVSREHLLAEVWGISGGATTRTLDNHVARLRKKLERDPQSPEFILTAYGQGYRLASD